MPDPIPPFAFPPGMIEALRAASDAAPEGPWRGKDRPGDRPMVQDSEGYPVAKLSDDGEGEEAGTFIVLAANFARAYLAHLSEATAQPVAPATAKSEPARLPPGCPSQEVQPRMIKAARALLSMDQETLAREAGVSSRTVISVEKGEGSQTTRMALAGYLRTRGIDFRASKGRDDVCVLLASPAARRSRAAKGTD